MKLEDVRNVSVIGAGIMGHGIAQTYALAGYQVSINDVNDSLLDNAMEHIKADLDVLVDDAFISQNEVNNALCRITTTSDLEKAVCDSDFVTEAIIEDSEAKRKLFDQLDVLCPPRTVLASNSSSLLISDFASGIRRRDKVILTHWFNPPHIVPAVEIIRGRETSDETAELVYALLKKVGKMPVRILKEIPGYLVNRIQMAMIREVWYLWEQGIASPEDIDLAVRGSLGFRLASIGPLLTADMAGIDTYYRVTKYLFPLINDSHEPPLTIRKMVEDGQLGAKSGKGVFDHSQEEWNKIIKRRDKEFLRRLKALYRSEKD